MEEYGKSPIKIAKKYACKILLIGFILGFDLLFYTSSFESTLWISKKLQTKSYLKAPTLLINLLLSPINFIAILIFVLTFRKNKIQDINLICSSAFLIYVCSILSMIFHKERPYWNKQNQVEGWVCANGFGYPSEQIIITLFVSYNFIMTNMKKQIASNKILKHTCIASLILINFLNMASRLIVGAESLNQIFSGCVWGYFFIFIYTNWIQNWLSKLIEKYCNTVNSFYKNHLFWISLGLFAVLIFLPILFYLTFNVFVDLSDDEQIRIQDSCSNSLILSSSPLDDAMLKSSIITVFFSSLMACFGSYTCNLTVIQRRQDVKLKQKFMKILVKVGIFLCLLGLFYIPFKFIRFDNIYLLYLFKYCLIVGIIFYVVLRLYPLILIQFQIHDEVDLELFFGKSPEEVVDLNEDKSDDRENEQEQEQLTGKIVEYFALQDGN